MIDENEIFPVLINIKKNYNNIILRFDDDILTQSVGKNCIKIIELVECENLQDKYDLLKDIVGESIDDHSKIVDGYCLGSFISMDSYKQIDISCKNISESTTNCEISDLIFRSKLLTKECLSYKKNYLLELSNNSNKMDSIITLLSNEINRLRQKELFYKESNKEKYLITKSKLDAYEEILANINKSAT